MSANCGQEMCPYWTGQGCACEVMSIDRPCSACEFNDCGECEDHDITGRCCCERVA